MSLSQDAHEERREANRKLDRRRRAKAFGLTLDEYNRYMEQACAICGDESEHLDHCHKTGKVRAALCRRCNLGLGHMRDNPDILRSAIAYLEEHQLESVSSE